jgi:hypothetical protein
MGNRAETEDEALGFEAAVAALGLKANVSEADHPLLCEGTRRQRGELRWSLSHSFIFYREVHQLMKAPLLPSYYSSNPPTTAQSLHRSQANRTGQPCRVPWVRTMAGVRAEEAAAEQSQQGFMQQAQEIADAQGAQMSQFLFYL